MNHLDEKFLELYVLHADSIRPRRKEIAAHLRECKGCAALHKEIKKYYAQVEVLQSEQKKASQALYAVGRVPQQGMFQDRGPIAPSRRAMPQRVMDSFKQYPIRWSAGFLVVVAVLAFLAPKFGRSRDLNPVSARPVKEFLVAYNRQGEELWKKHIGRDIDETSLPPYFGSDLTTGFPVIDVDGDKRNEIIGVFGWVAWNERRDSLLRSVICFNADGSERWRYDLHRRISLKGVPYSDDYAFYQIKTGDFDKDGNAEVIACASHIPWFPTVTLKLNARDGTVLSEYWHNGKLPIIEQRDIDGDGVSELFMGGQNNRLASASLAVLDPRAMGGQAPAPPEYTIDGVPPAKEKFYILFPASDLKPFWSDITNQVVFMKWREDSTLEVVVTEKMEVSFKDTVTGKTYDGATIYYYFNTAMQCVRVRVSDRFSAIRAHFKDLKELKGEIDAAYTERLRKGVQYWDREISRFVSYDELKNRRR